VQNRNLVLTPKGANGNLNRLRRAIASTVRPASRILGSVFGNYW